MPKVIIKFSKTIEVYRSLNLPDDKPIDLIDLENYVLDNQFDVDDTIGDEIISFNSRVSDLSSEYVSSDYVTIPTHRVGTETCIENIVYEGVSDGPPDVDHSVSSEGEV